MQKFTLTLLVIFSLSILCKSQTTQDTLSIKKAALDYFEGWYLRDTVRVGNALHPQLAKHNLKTKDGEKYVHRSTRESLLTYLKTKEPKEINIEELKICVKIYNINETIASAKVESKDYFDYIHLMKIDEEWKIINVLWIRKPKK